MRAHFNRALLDPLGNQITTAQIRLRSPGSTDLLTDTVYSGATGGAVRTNPWTATGGEVDFYLDSPTRVQIGITVDTNPEVFWDNIDVLAVAADSTHAGTSPDSTQVGVEASSTGLGATALGRSAAAAADLATALGFQTAASAAGSIAIGSQAAASQPGAVAAGESALAQGSQATALGAGAVAPFDKSTALGAGATVDRPNQIVIGTPNDYADLPGTGLALHSPDGTPFMIAVTNTGVLYAQELAAYVPPPPPDEGDGEPLL